MPVCARGAGAGHRRSAGAAPSAPTTGRFARSFTRSSTEGCRSLSRGLAARLRESAADLLAAADIVVPVPLHRSRRRRRGFNQARELAQRLGVPMVEALRRVRATPSQTDLPAGARHDNMRNAFALARGRSVEGLRIVLVDDVSTSGATIEACARVLSGRGCCGCQRGDGSPSRVSTDRVTSAATSALPRSPSRRTQPADAACRR